MKIKNNISKRVECNPQDPEGHEYCEIIKV